MKTLTAILASVGLVAAHGYVDNATIGGQFYQVSYIPVDFLTLHVSLLTKVSDTSSTRYARYQPPGLL
jgi:hypothetical protein